MTVQMKTVRLQIRRFDLSDDPVVEEKTVELCKNSDYNEIKLAVQKASDIPDMDGKVMKVRNQDYALIPPTYMLDDHDSCAFIVDISKISCSSAPRTTLIQDAYLNAIRKNLNNMESRVAQAERLIPQLQWRRQAHMEQTVNSMTSRVAFLNRRIDELTPPQWKSKMPQTAA